MMGMMWEGLLSWGERSKTVSAANMRGANDPRARENLLGSERGGNLINISVPWLIIIINIRNIIINNNLRLLLHNIGFQRMCLRSKLLLLNLVPCFIPFLTYSV